MKTYFYIKCDFKLSKVFHGMECRKHKELYEGKKYRK